MLHVVIATKNRHKFRELKTLLNVRGIRWHSLAEFPQLPPVQENGATFEANAIKKARAVARATGHLALADDSGIEVDALGGAPGVQSARFAGAHGNDEANNTALLRRLRGLPARKRRARYVCVLALATRDRVVALARGIWSGRIAEAPAGRKGFGYDPIFIVPRYGKTVGELAVGIKQRLSHRARAARTLAATLKRFTPPVGKGSRGSSTARRRRAARLG